MGGLVAYELSNLLSEKGNTIKFIGLIDSPAPGIKIDSLFAPESEDEIFQYIYKLSPKSAESLASIKKNNAPNYERFMQVWRAHRDSIKTYTPSKVCKDEITYFRARDLIGEMKFTKWEKDWIDWSTSGIEIHYLDGNHINIHEKPYVSKITEIIKGKIFSFHNNTYQKYKESLGA
jgi:thioesterase domain-containing protein